ncbi:hypothetical protein CBM2617_A70063 [Cupriavidus taiwanensis]|uniref:hypothetical protein n=1 Tax=Cupriavidus taiwanensis TaxID=164546 RepID=UPI000E14E086|nr:hypothetical protein [Cupriavidus taiwanensis]SOZ63499.1 hypothetical protein CBM2617_A70063 [Cupriavidus taiwanensis]SOZ82497.1 hypothetical protein CBM2618_A80063 [Cupriavidus taiwanensis]SOZ84384.1 hypothetical protein CBM2622_A80063 [Cupriavidus taiwanensis]SOZ92128.1 hypothetical protein CBM2621_A80063 [Cupriavidus taiwanensis]
MSENIKVCTDKIRNVARVMLDISDNIEIQGALHLEPESNERKFLLGSYHLLFELADKFDAALSNAAPVAAPAGMVAANAIIAKHFADDPANAVRAHAAITEILASAAPSSGEAGAPIGKILSAEEMGIGVETRTSVPAIWFGTPKPGYIYADPIAADHIADAREMVRKLDREDAYLKWKASANFRQYNKNGFDAGWDAALLALLATPAAAPSEQARGMVGRQYLCGGTRFKVSHGMIAGLPAELNGRWVAFVAADDDVQLLATPTIKEPLKVDAVGADDAPQCHAPEGWKLVPVNPSIAMCIRGAAGADNEINGHAAAQVYAFMLDAAETPPATGADDARKLELDMYRTFYGTLAPTEAVTDVLAERRRQMEVEGWTPEHDDEHDNGAMAEAAAAYAQEASAPCGGLPMGWPWAKEWWKPGTPRRMLVKAGALILAEIERIDRAALRAQEGA